MSFAIDTFTDVLIRSVNIRAEMHGQEPVPAIDIGMRLVGSNNWLLALDPTLKSLLYCRPGEGGGDEEDQAELDGVAPVSDMPELRCAALDMPVSLKREYSGCVLVIDYGLGGKSNIEIADCTVNNFRIEAKEGGTVEIDFRVQASGLDGPKLGKIGALVRHDVRATLTAPESRQADVTPITSAKAKGIAGGAAGNGAPEAGDIFAASVQAQDAATLDTTELPRGSPAKTAAFKKRVNQAAKAAVNKATAGERIVKKSTP